MKAFFYLLLFVVLGIFGLTFSLKNPQLIELSYYPDITISSSLAVVMLVTLLLGVLIGMLVTSVSWLSKHRELKRIRKDINKLNKQAKNLQIQPIEGSS